MIEFQVHTLNHLLYPQNVQILPVFLCQNLRLYLMLLKLPLFAFAGTNNKFPL